MNAAGAVAALQKAGLGVVTTSEAAALWRSSRKASAEMLRRLAAAGLVRRIRRGLWTSVPADPLALVERIAEPDFAYVSGLSALRIHGLIEQIPTDVHVATTGRARRVSTPFGRFAFRHLQPALFGGFEHTNGAPIASPEKALFDLLYWGAARGKSVRAFPEISRPRGFRRAELEAWTARIPSPTLRVAVAERTKRLLR